MTNVRAWGKAFAVIAFAAFTSVWAQPTPSEAPVRLRFVCWDGDEAAQALKSELKRFEAAHPNIKVKFEANNYSNYFEKLLTQFAADVAPDVVMIDPANFQRFSRRGALLPLNQFFDQAPDDVAPRFDINTYYPSIVDAHSLDGNLYVLPRDIAPIAVVYFNKRMFREIGLEQPPADWSWDFEPRPELGNRDFLTLLKRFQKVNDVGKVVQWGYVPGWQDLLTDLFVFGQGARYTDDPKDPKKMLFDDPRVMRAFQFSADLTLKDRLMPSSFDQAGTNARQMFTQQRVAMFHSGIWETPQLRKELNQETDPKKPPRYTFEWNIAIAPAYADGTRAYPTGGSGYGIMAKTRHPKEAWLLTQWMAGGPGMLAMARAGIAQPAIKPLALAEPWIPGPNTPIDQQVPANRIITDQAEAYVVFAPTGLLWNEVNSIARQPVGTVYTGDAQAKDVLPASNRIAQDRLDTLRREMNLPAFNWPLGAAVGLAIGAALIYWVYRPEFGKHRSVRERRENWAGYLFILPWLLGVLFFTAGPMIFSLLMSVSDWDIITPARFRGFGNYAEAFTIDPTFWVSLRVTLLYTLISVPAGIVIALALALLLNTKVRGIALWRTCYYIPAMASPIAGSLIWLKLFQPEGGLLNSLIFGPEGKGGIPFLQSLFAPLVGANGQINWLQNEKTALGSFIFMSIFGAGGGMVILLAALQGVPQYFYEAATLDGAGPWKRFRNVTVPLISPALFFSLITGFIGSFQVFTNAYQMTQGGPNNATMFFMLHTYNNAFRILRMGYASALAWVLFFVVLIFTIIQLQGNRYVHYEGAER
jgi:multiple sugar transport system permease protein